MTNNISYKHKFIWTAPPKVGSRSVKDVFRTHCDLNPQWPSDTYASDFTHTNNWPDGIGDDYLHITSVRHPYYRWVSYWKYAQHDTHELKRLGTDPLTAILEMDKNWFHAWTCHQITVNSNPRIDYIIHAETIEDDIKSLPFMSNYDITIPWVGKTNVPMGQTWDEQELRDVVYDRFRVDYDYFGYGKDDVFTTWDVLPTIPSRPTKNFSSKA